MKLTPQIDTPFRRSKTGKSIKKMHARFMRRLNARTITDWDSWVDEATHPVINYADSVPSTLPFNRYAGWVS